MFPHPDNVNEHSDAVDLPTRYKLWLLRMIIANAPPHQLLHCKLPLVNRYSAEEWNEWRWAKSKLASALCRENVSRTKKRTLA